MKERITKLSNDEWTATRVFAVFDEDKNGSMDRGEIEKAIIAITETVPSEEQLDQLFKKYDVNDDGVISLKELEEMVKDPIMKRKMRRRTMLSTKKKPVPNTQEQKEIVNATREDVMSKEIILSVEQEVEKAEEEAKKATEAAEAAEAQAAWLAAEAEAKKQAVAREEKICDDIMNGMWSTERVFAAFDADKVSLSVGWGGVGVVVIHDPCAEQPPGSFCCLFYDSITNTVLSNIPNVERVA